MAEPELENGAELPVGEYLRRAREAKGLQLEDAARVTKIGKNYLVAIEAGQFEKLPNAAYIKGFLRLYAGYLSLSGDDIVARYEKGLAPPPGLQPTATNTTEAESKRPGIVSLERVRVAGPGRWAVPALLLIAVVVVAVFISEDERPVAPPPAAPPAPAAVPAPAPLAVQKPLSSSRGALPAPPAEGESTATPPGKKGGIVLKLRFTQDSWLSITIDDSISQRYDLKAGDIIEWKGERSFVLDLGDGGAVEGELNGRPLKALGESGKPAHVELTGREAGQ
ncbi:helix-turn-helix domain-containing protein [Geomonas ferrireducens]|uniref:helix-turn-helix domain-containing protein n=1 Tax=Geomonas ferrireducens TaxID=2570227 RepID=UPI0010A8CC16|nr:helix-turn-helix domain-containing protein [Geomonas ferrireducens]